MKRLILCFDGTWNRPDDDDTDQNDTETNVCRIHKSVLSKSPEGISQIPWYQEGVGTHWYDKLRGGLLGLGLDGILKEGYKHLVKNYDDEDEIFLFGFSRGAYTARSLVGLIRNAGLLDRSRVTERARKEGKKKSEDQLFRDTLEEMTEEAYDLYRTRDEGPDGSAANFFRQAYACPKTPQIKFLGVWDTVGALGIPIESFNFFNKRKYEFHDTTLSKIVSHAYHAVAIDEHRDPYDVTLWNPQNTPRQVMEQRWFIGAHSNVGGGYQDRRLSDITLRWMQEKASACGLTLDPAGCPQDISENYQAEVTDSYMRFLGGKFAKRHPRYYRAIHRTKYGNESIDDTVYQRLRVDKEYHPKNAGFPTLEHTGAVA